jgi:hypothetical protein
MKSILVKAFFNSIFISIVAAQVWDLVLFPDESESEGEDDEFLDEDYVDENSTIILKLIKMSSSDILDEKALLGESSEVLINEIYQSINDDLIDRNHERINEIISEHTVALYNVLHSLKSYENDLANKRKIIFHDIYILSNDTDKINNVIESFYHENN